MAKRKSKADQHVSGLCAIRLNYVCGQSSWVYEESTPLRIAKFIHHSRASKHIEKCHSGMTAYTAEIVPYPNEGVRA